MSEQQIFTTTSVLSLASVAGVAFAAVAGSRALLPRSATWQDRLTFAWLTFDGIVHLIFEGPFLYLSTFGKSVNTSTGVFAEMWKEHTLADARWGVADPTLVSLEILTVLGGVPLCWYILSLLVKNDPARHYWIVVLCVAELYGGWMTFCPEWLIGSPALNTSNVLCLWVYLVFMNSLWLVIPLWLLVDSYNHIAGSLRAAAKIKVN